MVLTSAVRLPAGVAAAMLVLVGGCSTVRPIVLPAAQAELVGVELKTDPPESVAANEESISAHAPTAMLDAPHVTGFTDDGDRVVFRTPAKKGFYNVWIQYRSSGGFKQYGIRVNGLAMGGAFEKTDNAFAVHNAGLVELIDGENEISIEKGWGYFDVKGITLTPAAKPKPPRKVSAVPVSANAGEEARSLKKFLVGNYGKRTLTGVYSDDDLHAVQQSLGVAPFIYGADFMDYSPSRVSHGAKPDGLTEKLIEMAREGHIVTLSWHWNAPAGLIDDESTNKAWWRGFYTDATTFDFEQALNEPSSEDYRLLLADIDAIAVELRKLADAGVPVLWRPLHEADGGWFWWGAKGPESFKRLWRLLYDRLTIHHGLNNLLWVYTGSGNLDWYPPDDEFDIIGIDAYPQDPRDPLSSVWTPIHAAYGGKKMIALSEIGGVPELDRMFRYGVWWSYFTPWTGKYGPKQTPPEQVRGGYLHKNSGNLPAGSKP